MFGRLSREVGPLTDRGRANFIQSCSSERWGYFACPRNSSNCFRKRGDRPPGCPTTRHFTFYSFRFCSTHAVPSSLPGDLRLW
jgi:hypothetical protein